MSHRHVEHHDHLKEKIENTLRVPENFTGAKRETYWRNLEELADTEEFRQYLEREFPEQVGFWDHPVERRNILKLMGASFALAGVAACTRQPVEKIIPYVVAPENIIPGKPLHYASTFVQEGYGYGILVESHMGRPTHIEGNPDHPASLGASSIYATASILNMYDPDRLQGVTRMGATSSWDAFMAELRTRLEMEKESQGQGLRLLTETITSPTQAALLRKVLKLYPKAKWVQFDPTSSDHHFESMRMAFGEALDVHYAFKDADLVVSLDSDFLHTGPGHIRYLKDFSAGRKVASQNKKMNRMYAVESSPNLTGAFADHRIPVRGSEMGLAVHALVQAVLGASLPSGLSDQLRQFVAVVARDLVKNRGRSVIVAGPHLEPELQVAAQALNEALGNIGKTVFYTDSSIAQPSGHLAEMKALVSDMRAGSVHTLLMFGANPVYSAPADLDFAGALTKVGFRAHLTSHENETTRHCHWGLPESHFLETWGDARAYDGTASLIQPLIAPLYASKSAQEVFAVIAEASDTSDHALVKDYWKDQYTNNASLKANHVDFDAFWRKSLHQGVIEKTAFTKRSPSSRVSLQRSAQLIGENLKGAPEMEVLFRADPCVLDGRFANNGWLQELPKPLTKLTWDNAAIIAPATAKKLDLKQTDLVSVRTAVGQVTAPVYVQPGHPQNSVTVHLGYGRSQVGHVGKGAGFNAFSIRSSTAPFTAEATLVKVGGSYKLATTQKHHLMEGRPIIRAGTLDQFTKDPGFVHKMEHVPAAHENILSRPDDRSPHLPAWGMAINLNACTGCNACIISCQSENNIPITGKNEVLRGRELHWIRLDHYYTGSEDDPDVYHMPVPCMHCEKAPCEVVCPVNATVHSPEGLNEMVYNRCVGTRYCSNNCPYKVRRFNFFQYADHDTESVKSMRNPDVSVRVRGVMEKCTYCVQRIEQGKITSKVKNTPLKDGDVKTACQQACPTDAIYFGNINDPEAEVSKWKKEELNYELLGLLNTRPRTTYIAPLKNVNVELT